MSRRESARLMTHSFTRFAVAAICAIALAACSSTTGMHSGSSSLPPTPQASGLLQDDWYTFGHDFARTGFQAQNVGLSHANVAQLKLRWKRSLGAGVYASPVAYGGNIIVVTLGESSPAATVYDLRASDGEILWQRQLLGGVRATPTIDPAAAEVFVSDRMKLPGPSNVYALRLLDGTTAWQQKVPGITHASPVVADGAVYVGISGGDPPGCIDGGVIALDEATGAQRWRWEVNPATNGGGSVWGAIAYDGSHIIFGTGNTCSTPIPDANGAVALNLDGTVAWNFTAQKDAYSDDDTGGGVLLSGGRATFINKNGTLYSLSQGAGRLAWSTPLGAPDQQGGFATPSTDGTTIVIGAGLFGASPSAVRYRDGLPALGRPNDVISGYTSRLEGIDTNGAIRWTQTMGNRMTGDVAIVNGMAFAGLDQSLQALDLTTGKMLWRYATAATLDASPIVVPTGIYAADDAGTIYAFTIPLAAPSR
jgi:outer membrane protein assembly factor BamB